MSAMPPTSDAAATVRFAALLAGVLVFVHLMITFVFGDRITGTGWVIVGLVAAGALAVVVSRVRLRPARRQQNLLLHLLVFLVLVGSFWMHATLLWVFGRGAPATEDWFLVTVVLPLVWAVPLVVHAIAVLTGPRQP